MRLSDEPGSLSLYFNFNAYTPQGDKMVFSTPSGIAAVDLKTYKVTTVVKGRVSLLFVGRKTRQVYYETATDSSAQAKTVFAVDIDTGKTHVVARLTHGTIQAINADETQLAGVEEFTDQAVGGDGLINTLGVLFSKSERMRQRSDAKIPMEIFLIDLKTGARRSLIRSTDWLNHLQFSPVDPGLLLYCHEGSWQSVDRLWLIRTDNRNAAPIKVHTRTMAMEIAGHEWFSADGKTVWYDLQTPAGEDFWVAGYNVVTGARTRYHLERNQWSAHFNSSSDDQLFSGDGGDANMVARATDGKWLYLFRPKIIADDGLPPAAGGVTRVGRFVAEKLVNMKDHNYQLEPNARFSPDGKWLIFRSNFKGGVTHVYAVELTKG